jgi:hypothetical protein
MVSGYDMEAVEHEKAKHYNASTKKHFINIPRCLREHPRYQTGRWSDLAMCVVFRMLSTALET